MDVRQAQIILKKIISELKMGIKPATLWWTIRYSNYWASKTQMAC